MDSIEGLSHENRHCKLPDLAAVFGKPLPAPIFPIQASIMNGFG
jgi:hypothetical protein